MLPLRAVLCPLVPALRGDGIVAPPRAGLLAAPVGADEPGLLQAAKGGIERGLLELVARVGELTDGLVDLVAVSVAAGKLRQNDRIGVPANQIRSNGHGAPSFIPKHPQALFPMWPQYITRYLSCQGISCKKL